MFVQLITGKVRDADGLRRELDRWETDLRPGAEGFLGSTDGVTDDGRFVALARFESQEAAERNSRRPEQGAWWAEFEKTVEQVSFHDSVEVITMRGGGSDDAGFVQVMRGRVVDAAKLDALRSRSEEFEAAMASHRPDVLGGVTAVHADGSYTNAVYFTSEAEARANEAKEPPAEVNAALGEWAAAVSVEEYLDLREPRLT